MDIQYENSNYSFNEIDHDYGDKVHIFNNPYLLSLMAKAGHPDTYQPTMNHLVTMMYDHMFMEVANTLIPKSNQQIETRMKEQHQGGVYSGPCFDQNTKLVSVDLARAGTLPSQICYERSNFILKHENVRQDHFYINRVTNDSGEVIGVSVAGSKIGGPVNDAIVIFPDPMGATGSSMVQVFNHYKNEVAGKALAFAAIHMIITPEYIRKVTKECPELHIFALRLDRGTSSAEVLKVRPGKDSSETGLNEIDYIIPGAGGVGEVLNNAFV